MKLTWITDIHLNFLGKEGLSRFFEKLRDSEGEAVLISGDIAEAPTVCSDLKEMVAIVNKPIYFVLGNHDYYRSHVEAVQEKVLDLIQKESKLHWLAAEGAFNLGDGTVLVGEENWADGRFGEYAKSFVSLNDSVLIGDLFQGAILGKFFLLESMQRLAGDSANKLKGKLIEAIKTFNPQKIIVVTHVPSFKEACLYQGKISDDDYLPFYSSKVTGDILSEIAEKHPHIEFLVLCGHTHHKAVIKPRENLTVKVGGAEYGKPEIQEEIVL